MSVARVTKLTAGSPVSFQAAIEAAVKRANKTLRNLTGLNVVEQKAKIVNETITEYRVTLEITFILED